VIADKEHALDAGRFRRRKNGQHRGGGRLDRGRSRARLDREKASRIDTNCAQGGQCSGVVVVGVERDRKSAETLQECACPRMDRASRGAAGLLRIDHRP
jgi:hypothetical protein